MRPKISVIIPVYNPGDGFRRCIESICTQTLEDIEILFIDDKGTDASMDIVRDSASKDRRIRILQNAINSGSGFSRNHGIEEATGEYLSFIDADDYIERDFLELLYRKTVPEKPDIVKGELLPINMKGEVDKAATGRPLNSHIRIGTDQGKELYLLFTHNHTTAIYKRKLLIESGARYGLTRHSQDTTFLLRACFYAQSFELEDRAIYYYLANDGSMMRKCTKQRLEAEYDAISEQMAFIVEHCPESQRVYTNICARIESVLRIQAWAHQSTEIQNEAEQFLYDLKNLVLSIPYSDKLKTSSAVINGLIQYDVNLATWPYHPQGQAFRVEDRLEVVERWTDFMCANPECFNEKRYVVRLADVYKMLLSENALRGNTIKKSDRKQIYKRARENAKRIREYYSLKDVNRKLKLFAITGINLYQVDRFLKHHALHMMFPKLR